MCYWSLCAHTIYEMINVEEVFPYQFIYIYIYSLSLQWIAAHLEHQKLPCALNHNMPQYSVLAILWFTTQCAK